MKVAMVRCFNLVREWWGTMAGALSIPFAFLALFNIPGRLLFAVLAYASLCVLVISQNREIAKLRSNTKKLDIAVYDSFDDLVKQGEAMLEKFSNNERPLPTENEFQQWDKRLIAQAESCATIEERNMLPVGNPMPVSSDDTMSLYMIVGTELWPIAQKLVSKFRISHEIMARLRHESG